MATAVDTRAKELLNSITEGIDFSVPNVNFDDESLKIPEALANALQNVPDKLTNASLTEGCIEGNGTFDIIMKALKDHLNYEYESGRITGAEYTKAYIASLQGALQFAVQYLLGKDLAYYQALGTQAQALTNNIGAYTAKVQLAIAQAQAHLNKAQYANGVLGLASTDKQVQLLQEQGEQAHAQTSDTRLDGAAVTGYTGNQNSLLKQQVISFKKDAIIKSAKIYADSYTTQMSISGATSDNTGLNASDIGSAMKVLRNSMDNNS